MTHRLIVPAGVNAMLRKMAAAAASKPHVEIKQDGERFYIKTSTTIRTTEIEFVVGEEFGEETVDGRKCKVGWPTAAGSPTLFVRPMWSIQSL